VSVPVETVLDRILEARRRRIEESKARVPLARLQQSAEEHGNRRDFAAAISGATLRVIAELKQASPSRGILRQDYQPKEIASSYEAAGAAALSVLTEPDYFRGKLEDLAGARDAVGLPVLRKDFIVDDYQVYESAAAGADAILLIVAALADNDLKNLIELARRLKLATLVEVHTEEELRRAQEAGAQIIGVNNRDLKTLGVDLETSFRLRSKIPSSCLAVSESGIKAPADMKRLNEAGYDAVLIGERFMTRPDPGKELAELLGAASVAARPRV